MLELFKILIYVDKKIIVYIYYNKFSYKLDEKN